MSDLQKPSDPPGAGKGAEPDAEAEGAAGEFRRGDTVPGTHYRVVKLLGAGGHAAAYECENRIGKRVALKVLHRHLATNLTLVEKMAEEARRTVRLRHPNIVEVHDAGMTGGDRPQAFIEMELLQGSNGRQLLILKERIEVANALDILIDICHALDAAHRAGLVHQDLKPDNIFIHSDEWTGKRAVTKLLDFGIARVLGQAHLGTFEGTLAYAAPEQLQGQTITPKTDLYSLGVIAFELITGQRPFDAAEVDDEREAQAASGQAYVNPFASRLWSAILTQAAPRPCDYVRLPRELEALILQLLEKDPSKRPDSAKAVANALQSIKQSPSLPRSTMTTQELLLNAAHAPKVASSKGSTLRMGTIDVAAAARAMGLADPRAHVPVATGRLPGVAALPMMDRALLDAAPPPAVEAVGTFEPVVERRGTPSRDPSRDEEERDEGHVPPLARRLTSRGVAVACLALALAVAAAIGVVGARRRGAPTSTVAAAAPLATVAAAPAPSAGAAPPSAAASVTSSPAAPASPAPAASAGETTTDSRRAAEEPKPAKPTRHPGAPRPAPSAHDPLVDWLERDDDPKPPGGARKRPGF